MAENRTYNDSPTFIPARLESAVHGLNPVADAKDIYDIEHQKWQKEVNQEVEEQGEHLTQVDESLNGKYDKSETYSKTEVDAKESSLQGQINTIKGGSTKSIATIDNEINGTGGIDQRLEVVEELGTISVGGGDIGIATEEDFGSDTPTDLAKVPTVGAIQGGLGDGVYDISARNEGTTFDSLEALLNDDDLATLIPTHIRKGGMTIRFIQSSDNKYMQFRLISDSFTTNIASWRDCDGAKKYRLYNAFDIIGDSALNVSSSQIGTMLAAFPQDERKGFAAVLYRNNVNVPKIILFQSQNAANWENTTYWYDIAMTEEIKNSLVAPYSARDNVASPGIYKSNAPAYEALLFVSENDGNIGQLEIGMFHENQVIIRTRKKTSGGNWEEWTDYITSITQLQQSVNKLTLRKNVIVVRSTELIDIYTLIPNTDKYVNFKLRYINNVSDNVDYWRICDSYIGTLDGYVFTQEKQALLYNENEYVILINGASDYTGGLHGDEKIINTPILSLDGHLYPVSSLEANFVKVCDNISFIEYSNMYDTLAGDNSVFAKHYKLTEIGGGGISVSNTLKFIKNVSIKQLFAGLFCVHKDISSMFVGQDATIHDTSGDDSTTYPNVEPVDSKVVFSNPNNRLSAKCASWFIYGYDNDKGQIEVWDRTDDTKYYRRTNVAESIESGKVIKAHSECTFMYFPN